MPQRQYSKERTKVAKPNPRVILPITHTEYREKASEAKSFRQWLDGMIVRYPALFPSEIEAGYTLHDMLPASVKLPEVQFRRIKLKGESSQVLTICSSDVMPYMTGYTDEVEKALFLRRFGVPYWALSYVFGRNDEYWYNMVCHFGRYEIVGATVKEPARLPEHLLADEKHGRFHGEKGYIATTVGEDCVLGASLSLSADEQGLTDSYGVFREEAEHVEADYAPETVNTDGWLPTQKAWQALFPKIVVILCFLHAFIKIRNRTKRRYKALYGDIQQFVWDVYHAADRETFFQRMNLLQMWAAERLTGPALEAVNKLSARADNFTLAFEFPAAYRTSNMIDRPMIPLDRWLVNARYFHGHWQSAELQIRAWALFHNFMPYAPRSNVRKQAISPAHRLNGSVYHENWLHNLLISTSCVGLATNHRKS